MNHVVYVLGAGFSAPLGVPTVRDFISRAKDLYFAAPKELAHYGSVLERINDLARIKNYYSADLFNIEEVLSIIDMRERLSTGGDLKDVRNFIADVVKRTLLPLPQPERPQDWQERDNITTGTNWAVYIGFVMGLFWTGIQRADDGHRALYVFRPAGAETRYDVVTLNYDLVLEACAERLNLFARGTKMAFGRPERGGAFDETLPGLAKLHGSADNTTPIVPMTWSKTVHGDIEGEWRMAERLLSAANEIRIIGYSLPTADAYVRYLFKSAVMNSKNLRRIVAITLDSDGQTETRYRDFIPFPYFTFRAARTEAYLRTVWHGFRDVPGPRGGWVSAYLEMLHNGWVGS